MAKQIPVQIGGETYTLEFNWAALKRLGVVHPLDEDEVLAANQKLAGSMEDICAWFAAGLAKHHPELTIDRVESMMDYEAYQAIVESLTAAAPAKESDADPLAGTESSGSPRGSVSDSACPAPSSTN